MDFNPLPANFYYCAIDRNGEIIHSNLTGTRKRLCAQRFLVLERIRKLLQGGNRMKRLGMHRYGLRKVADRIQR